MSETEAVEKMRKGTLFLIIAPILVLIGIVLIGATAISGLLAVFSSPSSASSYIMAIGDLLGGAIVSLIMLIAGIVLGLVGLIKIRSGFKMLVESGKNVGVGYTGVSLVFLSIILDIISIALAGVLPAISYLSIISGILGLIGMILVGVGFYKTGKEYNQGLVEAGGILTAIVVIPLLPFIGFILIYVGLGNVKG